MRTSARRTTSCSARSESPAGDARKATPAPSRSCTPRSQCSATTSDDYDADGYGTYETSDFRPCLAWMGSANFTRRSRISAEVGVLTDDPALIAGFYDFVLDTARISEPLSDLTVAKTELEGALRSGDFGPDVGDALKAAIEECDSLGQLAEDLLIVARTDEDGLALLLEPLPVRTVLDGVRDRFIDRAASHDRDIVVDVEGDHDLFGDRVRLRQALGNLVDNALRHGAGTVTLRSSRLEDAVAIDVSDEGSGFAPDVTDRAFDRFARGDHARTRAGAGLGLAIVRALAEAHGGHATITDRSGDDRTGATVRVTLPLAPL